MSRENDLLAMLAQAVAGSPVDWVGAESQAISPEERETVARLRALAETIRQDRLQSAASEPGTRTRASLAETATVTDERPPSTPQSWGSLKILERIGSGGFGTVYRAFDPHLEREVALKLLHDFGSIASDRVSAAVAEGRMLARIRHPNVVTVHGADQIDGRVGIWMEFVEGRTLLQICREQGILGAQEASLVGLTLCSAIAAVHKNGYVHRDIKAQNVMRESGGRLVLMDFGAAAHVIAAAAGRHHQGTPLYLAPEVLEHREASIASDLYALGVLLYFLVTGTYPYLGANLDAIREAHRVGRSQRLHDVRPGLPDGFVRTVECALNPDRKRRFSSAGAMQFALGEVLGLRFISESIGETPDHVAEADRSPSVAVLPFSDMSPEKDLGYLCEGMAEELINALSALPKLHVAARSSSFQFGGSAQDVRHVGETLKVRHVVEGSVRKSGKRLRVTAQLVDVQRGYHLWSERYDRDLDDVFAVQDEIARAIVAKLKVRLREDSYRPLVKRHTEDLQAYNLYLQGRYYWSRRYAGGLERAIEYFSRAIAHDDAYARAYAGLADSFGLLGVYDAMAPRDAIARAKPAAERALALDDELGESHQAMALLKWYFDWDYDASIAEYERAIELDPASAVPRALFGILLADLGRATEAREAIRQAVALEPVSALVGFYASSAIAISGALEEAIPECKRTLDLDPTFLPGHWSFGSILSQLGRHDEAIEIAERALAWARRQSFFLAFAGRVYAAAGRLADADRILEELRARAPVSYVSPLSVAEIHAAAGRVDEAFVWLERACEERSPFLVSLGVTPMFDALRADPRFGGILTKVGLSNVRPPKRH